MMSGGVFQNLFKDFRLCVPGKNGNGNGTNSALQFSCQSFMETGRSWITDITCLPDGRVAVIDKWQGKLKLFDKFYKHKTAVPIPSAEALAAVARDTLVTIGDNQVRVYSTGIGIADVTVKNQKFKGVNFGVAFNGRYFAIVYENDIDDGYFIYILKCDKNEEITVRRKVQIDDNFEISRYIAMEGRSNKLFLGDITNSMLICLSTDGSVLWKRELSSWPRGLLVIYDRVLVATFYDHKIHCWTTQGEYCGVVLDEDDGIYFPLKLVYQKAMNKLLVQCDYYGDVKVYDLSFVLSKDENAANSSFTPRTDISDVMSLPDISKQSSIGKDHLKITSMNDE